MSQNHGQVLLQPPSAAGMPFLHGMLVFAALPTGNMPSVKESSTDLCYFTGS